MPDIMSYSACQQLFERNHLHLDESAYDKLDQYANLLIAESERQNVTAVRTITEIWTRHFLDSAYLLEYIEGKDVLDLGTGGGIPAIPLAIMNRELNISMLDSEQRKIDFCQSAIKNMNLNAQTICGRAEELSRKEQYEEKFDTIVSRAMANGSMLTELAVRFLRAGGVLLAMKGKQYDPTAERFENAADALGCIVEKVIPYELEHEAKNLIIIRKVSKTPEQYPRRFAKIKHSPL